MILAIDLGSTNFKAALFTDAMARVGESRLPSPYRCHDAQCVEMDVDAVRETVADLIRGACGSAGVGTDMMSSVAVTSQAQNFTVLDATGTARMPIISWLDRRSSEEAAALSTMYREDWHQHCSFATLSGRMQLSHLFWTRRHRPDVFEGDACVVTLPGLVFWMLAGVNLTDQNLAAMGGAYSIRDLCWRADVLKLCGLTPEQMPRLVPVGTPVTLPSACAMFNVRDAITLVPAGNDQTAGAFGNACHEGDVVVTLGTALVAYRCAGSTAGPYSANGCWGPYPGGGYYELAVSDHGCLALDWARETLMVGSSVQQFDEAVAEGLSRVTEKTGTFDPRRFRTPDAWQGDFGSDAEKAYAVLEGITFMLRQLVSTAPGCREGLALKVTGGGSRSRVWLQLIADVLNGTVSVGSGDGLLGAAAMAAGRPPPHTAHEAFVPRASRGALMGKRWRAFRNAHTFSCRDSG